MARGKCKFVAYDTKDDHLPPAQRVIARESVSQAGWAKANWAAKETALGIRDRAGKRETMVFMECGPKTWEQILMVHCTPGWGQGETCWITSSGHYPSEHELAGRRRRGRRPRR